MLFVTSANFITPYCTYPITFSTTLMDETTKESLFERPVQTTQPTILLVDASGSVRNLFDSTDDTNDTVFDMFYRVALELPEPYRLVFWNSDGAIADNQRVDQPHLSFFTKGVRVIPFILTGDKQDGKASPIEQMFTLVKRNITQHCLTYTHLAFDAIPDSWFSKEQITNIVLLTDGQIGHSGMRSYAKARLKNRLAVSIRSKLDDNSMARLSILTVEATDEDYATSSMETLMRSAGSDVYQVVCDEKLSGRIVQFKTYNRKHPEGHVHLQQTIAPPGFLPFRSGYFSPTKLWKFCTHVEHLIATEEDTMRILQDLVPTLSVYLKMQPVGVVDVTLQRFSSLFSKSDLDPLLINFILRDAISSERMGEAQLLTTYRERNKRLYQQADEILRTDTKNAVHLSDRFMTLPIGDHLVTGSHRLVGETWTGRGKPFKRSAVKLIPGDDLSLTPVLPLTRAEWSPMMEQCVRQWVREVVSAQYGVHVTSDTVIYVALGLCALASVMGDDDVIYMWQRIATTMWRKKRRGGNDTELDNVCVGNLPIASHDAKMDEFQRNLSFVGANILKLDKRVHPLIIWCALVEAWNPCEDIVDMQRRHCLEPLKDDFPDRQVDEPVLPLLKSHFGIRLQRWEVPVERSLDFTCPITLEDCRADGGWMFRAHQSEGGFTCNPVSVFSTEGREEMMKVPGRSMCPVCYAALGADDFVQVRAMDNIDPPPPLWTEVNNPFLVRKAPTLPLANRNVASSVRGSGNQGNTAQRPPFNGVLVVMKGTVGAGKSTLAALLKTSLEKENYLVYLCSVDHFALQGYSLGAASGMVTQALLRDLWTCPRSRVVVIIDTCGDKGGFRNIFGVDFTTWNRLDYWANIDRGNLKGYMAWTLRNVLMRGVPGVKDHFYLTPECAGVSTCVAVHQRKCRGVLGKKTARMLGSMRGALDSKSAVLESIRAEADEFKEALVSPEQSVQKFYSRIEERLGK